MRGRSRRLCGQEALSDSSEQMPATQSLFLFMVLSLCTEGGNKRWLYGSLWGAEWEPNRHMVNKRCNRPTAELRLQVIKWQQPFPSPLTHGNG